MFLQLGEGGTKIQPLMIVLSTALLISLTGCIKEKITEPRTQETIDEVNMMKLISPVFEHQQKIPSKYTCDGMNINPPLKIIDTPTKTKSLVLFMDDPDIPETAKKNFNVEVWDHWVVFNIPPDTKEIAEGKNPQGVLGKNTRGNNSYGGPCPPDKEHRYFFKMYALDNTIGLPEGSTKKEVEVAMKGHILTKAELIGRYERK